MVVSPTSLFANILFANMLNHFAYMLAGLSESLEVDSSVVKVSGQSRDILFKKHHLYRNAKQSSRLILTK